VGRTISGTSRPRTDRLREVLDGLLVDVADVVADEDVVERDNATPRCRESRWWP